MTTYVQAGKLTDLFNKIVNTFLKGLEDLVSDGKWKDETKDISEKGEFIGTQTTYVRQEWANGDDVSDPDESVFKVEYRIHSDVVLNDDGIKQLKSSGGYNIDKEATTDLYIWYKSKNPVLKKESIKFKESSAIIDKFKKDNEVSAHATTMIIVQKILGAAPAEASKTLKISLTKITGSKEISINLNKINANYDLSEAFGDIDAIVSDDEFIDSLPDDKETFFEVTSDESDDYDVQECCDFDTTDCLYEMLYDAVGLQTDLSLISLAASGKCLDKIRNFTEEAYWSIKQITEIISNVMIVDNHVECFDSIQITTKPALAGCCEDCEATIQDIRTFLSNLDSCLVNFRTGVANSLKQQMQYIESAIYSFERKSF